MPIPRIPVTSATPGESSLFDFARNIPVARRFTQIEIPNAIVADSWRPSTGSWAPAIHPTYRRGRPRCRSVPFVRHTSSRICSWCTRASRSTVSRTSSPTRSSRPSGWVLLKRHYVDEKVYIDGSSRGRKQWFYVNSNSALDMQLRSHRLDGSLSSLLRVKNVKRISGSHGTGRARVSCYARHRRTLYQMRRNLSADLHDIDYVIARAASPNPGRPKKPRESSFPASIRDAMTVEDSKTRFEPPPPSNFPSKCESQVGVVRGSLGGTRAKKFRRTSFPTRFAVSSSRLYETARLLALGGLWTQFRASSEMQWRSHSARIASADLWSQSIVAARKRRIVVLIRSRRIDVRTGRRINGRQAISRNPSAIRHLSVSYYICALLFFSEFYIPRIVIRLSR